MNINAIQAFVTVACENSFSEAAEKLHLTQPGMSKRIQALENYLKCQLFDRIGRRIFLTQAGKEFLPHAYNILQAMQNGNLAIQNLSTQVQGELVVATTQHIGLYHLKDRVKDYVQRYPKVDFTLDFVHSRQAYAGVLQGKLELAVITEPSNIDKDLAFIPTHFEALSFVCNPEHPLAKISKLTLKQLSQHPAVLPDAQSYTRQLIDHLFQAKKLSIQARVPSNYLEALKMLVSAGLGWSVLPKSIVDDSLHVLPFEHLALGRQLGYLIHKQRSLSTPGKAFIDSICDVKD